MTIKGDTDNRNSIYVSCKPNLDILARSWCLRAKLDLWQCSQSATHHARRIAHVVIVRIRVSYLAKALIHGCLVLASNWRIVRVLCTFVESCKYWNSSRGNANSSLIRSSQLNESSRWVTLRLIPVAHLSIVGCLRCERYRLKVCIDRVKVDLILNVVFLGCNPCIETVIWIGVGLNANPSLTISDEALHTQLSRNWARVTWTTRAFVHIAARYSLACNSRHRMVIRVCLSACVRERLHKVVAVSFRSSFHCDNTCILALRRTTFACVSCFDCASGRASIFSSCIAIIASLRANS